MTHVEFEANKNVESFVLKYKDVYNPLWQTKDEELFELAREAFEHKDELLFSGYQSVFRELIDKLAQSSNYDTRHILCSYVLSTVLKKGGFPPHPVVIKTRIQESIFKSVVNGPMGRKAIGLLNYGNKEIKHWLSLI